MLSGAVCCRKCAASQLTHRLARLLPKIEVAVFGVAIDLLQLRSSELELLEGVERVVELIDVARADERRSNTRVAQHPSDCHLRERLSAALRDVVESAHALEICFAEELLQQRGVFEFGAGIFRNAFEIFAGQQSLSERRKCDATDAEIVERGEKAFFDPAIEHGIGRLMNEQRDAHLLRIFAASRVRSGL